MTESMRPFIDAIEKIEEARQELEKGITKSDRDAAIEIFNEMCTANSQYTDKANTVYHLALASLSYAQAALRDHISVQATTQGSGSTHETEKVVR
jgi:hypothetical protein